MPDFYAQVGTPTEWCLVQAYADMSGVIAAWGPFPTEQDAKDASVTIRDVVDAGVLTVSPFRRVTTSRPHKPGMRGTADVNSPG